jgi:hypothetical protein
MLEHFYEGVGIWGRSSMIEIGVPEDVVDMYIEKVRQELKDPHYQLSLTAYVLPYNNTHDRWYVTARKPGRSRSSSPKGVYSPKRSGHSPPSSSKRS